MVDPAPEPSRILSEPDLPDSAAAIARGHELAKTVTVGPCPFLAVNGVACEADFKRRAMRSGRITRHAQIGFRDPAKSRRAWHEIWDTLARDGIPVDRYGICLDWSMGYPRDARKDLGRGTGMILDTPEAFAALTAEAPVAPHFGDFVVGMPSSVENTCAALQAGATAIGNLGQYFTFRMPQWDDDVGTTEATVTALALIGAQPVEVLVHSNLDDGFAALFTDLACALGAVLIERHIVEDLIGAPLSHCYGNTFGDPVTRLAFLLALGRVQTRPGTMVYGNTTRYGAEPDANWGTLAAYMLTDVMGQRLAATGHALNPVPVTEAQRIPDIDEVIAAHRSADRLIAAAEDLAPLTDPAAAIALTDGIVEGGLTFRDRVFRGFADAGIDTSDPLRLLLAIRRLGPKRLEELYGPGAPDPTARRGRRPKVQAPALAEIRADGIRRAEAVPDALRADLAAAGLSGVAVATDVHEYGKVLLEEIMDRLGIGAVDGGTHGDPKAVVAAARRSGADFVAVSTYNGVALRWLEALTAEMDAAGLRLPIFIGGKLNQIPEGSNSSLPVDVSGKLAALGATVCAAPEDMLAALGDLARRRTGGGEAAE